MQISPRRGHRSLHAVATLSPNVEVAGARPHPTSLKTNLLALAYLHIKAKNRLSTIARCCRVHRPALTKSLLSICGLDCRHSR
jgi:hypothetical protein